MPVTIRLHHYGPPEALRVEEVDLLVPKDDELVIAVSTAGVNRADIFIRSGEWQQAGTWPYVPGLEACGVVARYGKHVEGFSVGEPVITMMQRLGGIHGERPGGYAQEVCVPAAHVAKIPASVNPRTLAILGLPAVTALLAVEKLAVEQGMRALVHGGSSAVGLIAIQLLKNAGVEVAATSTSSQKFPVIEQVGAGEVVLTRSSNWHKQLAPVERIFDLVGAATFPQSIELLQPDGRYLFVGGTSGAELKLDGWALMRPITLSGYSSETLTGSELQQAVNALGKRFQSGQLKIPAAQEFPLQQAAAAHAQMETGKFAGRIVLTTD